MPVEITIPSPGESINEVVIGPWLRAPGEWVEKDDSLVEIESDKVTLEIPAPESGLLAVNATEGEERTVGDVIGSIDPSADKPAGAGTNETTANGTPSGAPSAESAPSDGASDADAARNEVAIATASAASDIRATPLAKKIAHERGVDLSGLTGSGPGGRVAKADVLAAPDAPDARTPAPARPVVVGEAEVTEGGALARGDRPVRRERMSKLRQRIAERLVEAQRTAAMLTTFNEADMTEVMRLRKKHKEAFAERYGVGLGFMSFFATACASALKAYPGVNAYIVGNEVEYHDFVDLSIAVGTPKGLVVPVLRNIERLSFAGIEQAIRDVATRARDGKLTIDEMTGGTFTISNGGVYGSLMSTPILNPPQSGILGMHKIMQRPVEDPANPGQLTLRPMMYLALSYDHRVVDGEQAVRFLVHVKECIEEPEKMLFGL